jgi:hypothetical protein
VHGIFDAGDPASGFDLGNPFFEQALPIPGTDDCEPFSFGDRGIVYELPL